MTTKAREVSDEWRRALTPPSARRTLPRQAPLVQRKIVEEGEDGNRPLGRYDGRRAALPPGNELASTPREDVHKGLQKSVKAGRVAMRAQHAKRDAALEKRDLRAALAAGDSIERLRDDDSRLHQALDGFHDGLAVAGVEDPLGDGKSLIKVSVNRRVDVLEQERSRHLITEGAYRTGRIVQTVFERLGTVGGSNWCGSSRIDAALANELKMFRTLEAAETIGQLMDRIRGRLGELDTRLLRRVLGDRMSFADCAALVGKAGDRGQRYVALRYRDALEELTKAWTFRGAIQPVPDDKYAAAAAQADERQDQAMAEGATLARLEDELGALESGAPLAEGENRPVMIARTRQAVCDRRLGQAMARARRARR